MICLNNNAIISLSTLLLCISSCEHDPYCPNESLIVGTIYARGNNATSPFYYEMDSIILTGGIQPYQLEWQGSGYVRHDIIYHNSDSAILYVYYGSEASYLVNISSPSPCTPNTLVFKRP
jgi:hypothetical protein